MEKKTNNRILTIGTLFIALSIMLMQTVNADFIITEVSPRPNNGTLEFVELYLIGYEGTDIGIVDNFAGSNIKQMQRYINGTIIDYDNHSYTGYAIITQYPEHFIDTMNTNVTECLIIGLTGRIGNGLADSGDEVHITINNNTKSFYYTNAVRGKSYNNPCDSHECVYYYHDSSEYYIDYETPCYGLISNIMDDNDYHDETDDEYTDGDEEHDESSGDEGMDDGSEEEYDNDNQNGEENNNGNGSDDTPEENNNGDDTGAEEPVDDTNNEDEHSEDDTTEDSTDDSSDDSTEGSGEDNDSNENEEQTDEEYNDNGNGGQEEQDDSTNNNEENQNDCPTITITAKETPYTTRIEYRIIGNGNDYDYWIEYYNGSIARNKAVSKTNTQKTYTPKQGYSMQESIFRIIAQYHNECDGIKVNATKYVMFVHAVKEDAPQEEEEKCTIIVPPPNNPGLSNAMNNPQVIRSFYTRAQRQSAEYNYFYGLTPNMTNISLYACSIMPVTHPKDNKHVFRHETISIGMPVLLALSENNSVIDIMIGTKPGFINDTSNEAEEYEAIVEEKAVNDTILKDTINSAAIRTVTPNENSLLGVDNKKPLWEKAMPYAIPTMLIGIVGVAAFRRIK
ncbi:MAG: hypothetical protein ACMXYL_01145 [Candidatus Woesearchaeota archaeon]